MEMTNRMISCDWGNVASRLAHSLSAPPCLCPFFKSYNLTTASPYIDIRNLWRAIILLIDGTKVNLSAINCEMEMTIVPNFELVPFMPDLWSDQADLRGSQHGLTSGFLCSFHFEAYAIIRSVVIAKQRQQRPQKTMDCLRF